MIRSRVPTGWDATTLGALGEYINGRGFKKSEWSDPGRPIIRIQNLTGTAKETNYYAGEVNPRHVAQSGDLLVSWAASLGAYIWDGPEACVNQHIFKVVSNIDRRFHYYLLTHVLDDLRRQSHGSGMVHITRGRFDSTPVAVPPPDLQRSIAARLDELFSDLDAGVLAIERAKANLTRYRAAVLKAAVEGEVTRAWRRANPAQESSGIALRRALAERKARWEEEQLVAYKARARRPPKNWKARYQVPSGPQLDGLAELPATWVWTGIEWLCSTDKHALKAGPFGSSLKKSSYTKSGYKVYGQEQVIRGDPYYGDYYVGPAKFEALQSCSVRPGDLLISLVGTVGRTLILPKDAEPGIINPRLIKVTFNRDIVLPEFVQLYLASPSVKGVFKRLSHGGTMEILNMSTLRGLAFPVPPVREQAQIIAEVEALLSQVDQLRERSEKTWIPRAERLRQAVLSSAFRGELPPTTAQVSAETNP